MRKFVLCMIFTATALMTGCGKEIDDMAYVVAIGVDKADTGYEFTFAIGNPDSINSDKDDALVLESADSTDIFTAGDLVGGRIGQEINFSHAELIVFSETVATDGVGEFLDSLTRNLNQRPKLVPAVAVGSAKEKLQNINSEFEGNPEKYLKKVFESVASPSSIGTDGREFLCRTKNINIATALPLIGGDDEISSTGMAVFRGERLVATCDDLLSYKLLSGTVENMDFDADGLGSVNLICRSAPAVNVICDSSPVIAIKVNLDASVNTITPQTSSDALFREVEVKLRERLRSFLDKTAEMSSDILGFERYARKNFLTWDEWEKYEWQTRYGGAKFDVDVNLIPTKTGLVKG